MSTCSDFAVLITLRATGDLEPFELERVEKHLARCERCRAEAAADAEVLGLARLPPMPDAEQRAAAVRPGRALSALHARDARRARALRWGSALAVIAAALLAVLAPALLRRAPTAPPAEVTAEATAEATAAATAAAWESPDLETIWEETAVLDLDATSSSDAAGSGSLTDAALAAADL